MNSADPNSTINLICKRVDETRHMRIIVMIGATNSHHLIKT